MIAPGRPAASCPSPESVSAHAPGPDRARSKRAQAAAYGRLAESNLLKIEGVAVDPAWLPRRRGRGRREACGEGVNDEREVRVGGRTLCRGCAGERYYTVLDGDRKAAPVGPDASESPAIVS
jgi:formylmethanofuran dehydrogenase subunit E